MPAVSSRDLGRAAAATCLTAGALLAIQVIRIKRRRGPKNFKDYVPLESSRAEGEDCTRDRFSQKKLPRSIDVVVVGSGIGGLYLAALLAKSGRAVLVLEQHYVAGGCTHEFTDKGWTFDTGVHYVGRVEKYGKLLDLVSDEPIKFAQLGSESDGFVYDRIKLGEEPVQALRAGREHFIEDLQKRFPEEKEGIEKYVELVTKCNKGAELHFFGKLFARPLELLLDLLLGGKFKKLATRTAKEVLDELFSSELLKSILLGQFGDYGMRPSAASFFIHSGIVSHYLEGGYYPVGGPQRISRGLIRTIEKAGGRVLVNAPVARVEVARNRVTGVTLRNGTQIPAPLVVSAAGAEATSKFFPQYTPPRKLQGGISHMYAFLGLRGTAEELELSSSNLWALPSPEIEGDLDRYYADPWPMVDSGSLLLFVGFPSAKDPEAAARHPGKSTCVIITEAKEEWFSAWRDAKQGKRGADYEQLKKRFEEGMVKGLLKHFPQLEGKIEYVEMGSPLSNMHYLNRAASYGLQHPPSRYTVSEGLRPGRLAGVEGMWMTGQDVTTNGFAGALMGGVLTAHGILGYGFWDLVVCGRDLITDMMRAQK
ncbi:retsat [Symbiodinium microadriaticum]|nr:retsat [Symbiodinium microadriaticum]